MCRFVLYHGEPITVASLVTEPAHSLIRQSTHAAESEEPLNGDGFGLAWYVPDLSPAPGLFRSITPAWSNRNLAELARVTRSHCVFAHVRAATQGLPVAEMNCHPFTHGPWAFMHNGDVARFNQIKRRLLADLTDDAFMAIKGSTDSEHLFAVFLDQIHDLEPHHAKDRGQAIASALEHAIHRVVSLSQSAKEHLPRPPEAEDDECWINCAVSDGVCTVAARFTTDPGEPSSLYVHSGKRYICQGGVCRMVAHQHARGAAIVCSEPLSDDPGWLKVPRNHLVIIREDGAAQISPITA